MQTESEAAARCALQWGPALKAGRNRPEESAVSGILGASMGPGPKGREEPPAQNARRHV